MESFEVRRDRFRRLAEKRTNQVIKALEILGHCGNKHSYAYGEADVNKIFLAIEKKLNDEKQKFKNPTDEGFKL
ncbi:hypothetical protein N9K06_01405 [Omnitrophica bacterium]|nr:hypothetical protein [Candidatus Omnitrophota bacterium]